MGATLPGFFCILAKGDDPSTAFQGIFSFFAVFLNMQLSPLVFLKASFSVHYCFSAGTC